MGKVRKHCSPFWKERAQLLPFHRWRGPAALLSVTQERLAQMITVCHMMLRWMTVFPKMGSLVRLRLVAIEHSPLSDRTDQTSLTDNSSDQAPSPLAGAALVEPMMQPSSSLPSQGASSHSGQLRADPL